MTVAQPKKSDLGVRVASAVVMIAVAGTALWLGGWVWTAFVALVALGVLWEWWGLVTRIFENRTRRLAIFMIGSIYICAAVFAVILARLDSIAEAILPIITVVAVDVGAYFSGRTFGGPKIAPKISPSKTWSGLVGGAISATALLLVIHYTGWLDGQFHFSILSVSIGGVLVAVIAQAGDFLESWVKRHAGVKDSGKLIPGHGGLLDRLDGLLAVLFTGFVVNLPYWITNPFWQSW